MNLGQAVGEAVRLLEHVVGRRKLHKFQLREYFFHFPPDVGIKAVIVTEMQKSPGNQVVTQVFCLLLRKDDVAVTGSKQERVVEQFAAARLHDGLIREKIHPRLLVAIVHQVRKGGPASIPISAAAVFQPGDAVGRSWIGYRNQRQHAKRAPCNDRNEPVLHSIKIHDQERFSNPISKHTARPAVSVRKRASPKLSAVNPCRSARSTSSGVKSPSGPISTSTRSPARTVPLR